MKKKVLEHLEKYFRNAIGNFEKGEYGLSVFFSITLIEELGKLILRYQEGIGKQINKGDFFDHHKKYVLAVHHSLMINARVTRIYGDIVSKFASWFESGQLFQLRNKGIYLERKNGDFVTPSDQISKEDAFLLVCFSGEIYGELQYEFITGTGPDEWQKITAEVDEFRERHIEIFNRLKGKC